MRFIREKTNELNIDHEEIFSSQMAFFKVLCAARNAQQILELGTFMGYSTAGFAEFLREKESKGHITTIERDSDRSKQAKQGLATDGLDKYVTFIFLVSALAVNCWQAHLALW
jgi:predicted O-methyltransferase YrrM